MKNSSLIVNVVLAIAVAALYVLHFTGKQSNSSDSIFSHESAAFNPEGASIAWVNVDSILNNFDMYFDIQKELESKGKVMETDMTTRTRNFEKQMVDFQEKVQKGLVTRSVAQQMQQDLAEQEQQLYLYRDELRMRFAEEEQVMLRKIQNSITDYMKEYSKGKDFQVIIGGSFGGPLLYGHPSIDITKDVLKGLNEEYIKTRPSKK